MKEMKVKGSAGSPMLSEVRRLFALGLAPHWLKPKSKVPIASKWSSGERQSHQNLKDRYRKGMNLGIRLGPASDLGDGHLAVIDVDVKSKEERHRKEVERKLEQMFPGLLSHAPIVLSGRGNGSRHIYIKVEKRFLNGRRLAQSSDKVKVLMPSREPSAFEKAALSEAELADGFRLKAAWEIDLLIDGRQVVAPPSVHPDTGRAYRWQDRACLESRKIPVVDLSEVLSVDGETARPHESKERDEFQVTEVRLSERDLPVRCLEMLNEGTSLGSPITDRSAALMSVAIWLCKAGLTDNEIANVLTDRQNALGATAFEHAKSVKRSVAARWVLKYTIAKARRTAAPESQFSNIDQGSEVPEQISDWRVKLDKNIHGVLKCSIKNIHTILVNSSDGPTFKRDEFAFRDFYGTRPPWNSKAIGDSINDTDLTNIIFWLANAWRIEPSDKQVAQVVSQIGSENRFHPVRDYLRGLKWDGVNRIDRWLEEYLGAEGSTRYLSAVSRKVLCAAVARAFEPGIKFDSILVLEGAQGIGKSTAVQILGGKWFSDSSLDLGGKDAIQALQGRWIVELAELVSLSKADVERLKAFVSSREDHVRLPYARLFESYPRQSIFIGTTNSDSYLRDRSGNRRFWPVRVAKCDLRRLRRDRNQLFAEAVHHWDLYGEKLYFEDPVVEALAKKEQDRRLVEDPWTNLLKDFLNSQRRRNRRFEMRDLFDLGGPLERFKMDHGESHRAGALLRELGCEKTRSNGKNYWIYRTAGRGVNGNT